MQRVEKRIIKYNQGNISEEDIENDNGMCWQYMIKIKLDKSAWETFEHIIRMG